MIGSPAWIKEAQRTWEQGESHLPVHLKRGFDPVRAFRSATLKEACSLRPRRWFGSLPWKLHDYEQPSELDPRFVAYLDTRLKLKGWREKYRFLLHQDLNWWRERLGDLTA